METRADILKDHDPMSRLLYWIVDAEGLQKQHQTRQYFENENLT